MTDRAIPTNANLAFVLATLPPAVAGQRLPRARGLDVTGIVDGLGFLADQASRHDLTIYSLMVLSPGYPMVIGLHPAEDREVQLGAWLQHLEEVRWSYLPRSSEGGDTTCQLRFRGVLVDRVEGGSVLVSVCATYDRDRDQRKVGVIMSHVYTVDPAELLALLREAS